MSYLGQVHEMNALGWGHGFKDASVKFLLQNQLESLW